MAGFGSTLVHLTLVSGAALVFGIKLSSRQPTLGSSPQAVPVEVDLSVAPEPTPPKPAARPEPPIEVNGGSTVAHPDTGKRGRGGTEQASDPAVNLADRAEGLRLVKSLASHLDRDQVSRLLRSRTRRSWDDERLTSKPMELTLLVSGTGHLMERREDAPFELAQGLWTGSRSHETQGSTAPPNDEALRNEPPGTGELDRVGLGSSRATGTNHSQSGPIAFSRPMVQHGMPSIPAPTAGNPTDNVDASQRVAQTVESLTHASTPGGTPGEGQGGQRARTAAPASGGDEGNGFASRSIGGGPGLSGPEASHPGVLYYRRQVVAKIWPHWSNAFPQWAIDEHRQGYAIVGFVIHANGSVSGVTLQRPSSIEEYDRNCLKAVRLAAPFPPIPHQLNLQHMTWSLTFDVRNPWVR